jgi:hypothetical protein
MISNQLARSLVALLALSVGGAAAAADHGHVQPIATARRAAVGSTVTIRGTVTVPTGAFDGGFAVQQGNAGIYVLDPGDGVSHAIGQEVEVTGTITDSSGLLAITPSAIAARGRGSHIEARRTRTGSVGEATEGRMLRLEGTMVGDLVDDSPFGFKLDIDDGSGPIQVFLFPGSGISTAGLVAGARLDVTCFSNQFEVFFECDPRQPADLTIEHGHHGHD